MKKVLLSSMVIAAVLSGCGGDSSCCNASLEGKAAGIPPVAMITDVDIPTTISLGQSVTANAIASSDRDGTVVGYKWSLDGSDAGTEQSPTYTFNTPGDHELCLTVTDNDKQDSVNVECRTITVLGKNSVTPVNPTAVIDLSDEDDMSAQTFHTFSCANSHDNDTLGTSTPLGKDHSIVSCEWDIQSYAIDEKGNMYPYRNCSSDAMDGKRIYICPNAVKIIAKLKVTDNDGQTHSTTKEYNLR